MEKMIILNFLYFLVVSCCNQEVNTQADPVNQPLEKNILNDEIRIDAVASKYQRDGGVHIFLGYWKEKPVFYSKEDELFFYNNGRYQFFREHSPDHHPMYIDSELMVFRKRIDDAYQIVLQFEDSRQKRFKVEKKPLKVTVSPKRQHIYYSDGYESKIKYLNYANEEFGTINAIGFVHSISNDLLYFTTIPDPAIIHPNVNLNLIDLTSQETKLIIQNISDENICLSSDNKFLYCSIFIDGGFQGSIYSIEKSGFHLLKDEEFSGLFGPYYGRGENAFIFYGIKSLDIKAVEIPTSFSFIREK